TIAGIWLAVKPLPNPWGWSLSHWLWPFPGGRLAYVFTVMMCVNVALATFVLVRRVNGTGYSIGWGHHWSFFILASFLAFACIASSFYGWTWRKTGSIFASALVHGAVDITWHFFFRTL